MNKLFKRAISVLIGGALIASACSSGGDDTSQVVAGQTSAPEITAAAPAQVVIEANVVFGPTVTGMWNVVEGADALGCDGGTLTEFSAEDQTAQELTCSGGDREGAFVGRFSPFSPAGSQPSRLSSSWDVIVASGDFEDLSGVGQWDAESSDAEGVTFTLTLEVTFGDVAAPVATLPRIVQLQETNCEDGVVTTDGLTEYATVDGTMFRLDLVTGEMTEHGVAPAECAQWLGDPDLGRRVALTFSEGPSAVDKVSLGPFDGEWDVELEYDEVTLLLSRSMTANRLILSHPESGTIFLLDATTGAQVGEDIDGNFADSRLSVATATSADGRLVALGGAGTAAGDAPGQLLILDAESGAEIARLETDAPPTALAFDDDGGALVAGLFTGAVVTIDTVSLETVSTVGIGATARIAALGIRPDGLVVVATDAGALVVDRITGPTGAEITWRHEPAARIRPDGSITFLTVIQTFEVYKIEG